MTCSIQMLTKSGNHFTRDGAEYAKYRPTYPTELVDYLTQQCKRHELALDVGCGSGQLANMLAARFEKIVAIDPSEEQLKHAPLKSNIEYRCEPAERTSLDRTSADLIVAAQAAHWFDLKQFYSEIYRISRPGTIVALICYGVPVIEGAVGDVFDHFYWQDIFCYWPEERRQVEAGYENIYFPFREIPMLLCEIERNWSPDSLINYIKTWSAVKTAEKQGDCGLIENFSNQLFHAWGDEKMKHRVIWPVRGRIGILP